MNAKQVFVVSIISASAMAAFASAAWAGGTEDSMMKSRADMKAQVLQARANGELRPAGEAVEPLFAPSAGSTVTRAAVYAEVLQAREHGELIPSGEAVTPFESAYATHAPALAREAVRDAVRTARLHGELIPSGEGFGPVDQPVRPAGYGSRIFVWSAHR